MFDEYYQGKLNNTKGCEEDDRNDGQDDPEEEETRFFLWITGDPRYAICIAPTILVDIQNVSHHWRKYKDINTQNAKYIAVTFSVAMMSKVNIKMYRIIEGNTTKLTHKVRKKCCHLLNGYDEQYYTYIEIQTLTQNAKYIAVTFLVAMMSNIIHI